MKDFLWALNFLTVVPTGKGCHDGLPNVGKVAFWFPIVGLLIGVALTFIYLPVVRFFPHLVADAIILIAYIIITGGFHLDGFADSCDGLFGGDTRERKLEIMRDSQIGSYGTLCLICTVGLKYLCLVSIDPKVIAESSFIANPETLDGMGSVYLYACEKGKVLFFMCAIGRWCQTLAASLSTYAREGSGTGQIIIENINLKHVLFSSFIPGVLIILFCGVKGIFIFFIAIVVTVLFTYYVKRKIKGMTGDTLGAVNEVSELMVLLSFLVI